MTALLGITSATAEATTLFSAGTVYYKPFVASDTGDAASIFIYIWGAGAASGRGVAVGLFDNSNNRLAYGDLTDTSATGWNEVALNTSVSITSSVTYKLGFLLQDGNLQLGGDGASSSWDFDNDVPYPTFTDPLVKTSGATFTNVSLYAATAAASSPTITDAGDELFQPGESITITGTGFGATQGTGSVTIGGWTQTVTAWGDTSITITVVQGGNAFLTNLDMVVTDGSSNASDAYTVQLEPAPILMTWTM